MKKLLRNPISLLFLCFFAMSFLAGCREETMIVEDNPEDLTQDVQTNDPLLYMAIKVVSVDDVSSRADGFDSDDIDKTIEGSIFNKGLEAERLIFGNTINHDGESIPVNFALIFDKDGKKIGDLMSSMLWVTPDPTVEENDYITQFRTYYFAHKKSDFQFIGEGGVDKILVILNAHETLITKLKNIYQSDISDAYSKILTLLNGPSDEQNEFMYFINNGRKYFTMSSSMVISSEADNKEIVAPFNIGKLKFYPSRLEAEANIVSMYVERLQAKHTVLFKKKGANENNKYYYFDSLEEEYEVDGKTYVPSSHLVLASDADFTPFDEFTKLSYVTSYTRNDSIEDLADPSKPSQFVKTGNWKVNITGWGMNAEEKEEYLFKNLSTGQEYFRDWHKLKYRNFWAVDPNYSDGTYPDQYRKINGEGNNLTDAPLNYYPYNALLKREVHQYTPENTFDKSLFTNPSKDIETKKFLRVGTHVIVSAQLLIDGFEEEGIYSDSEFDDEGLVSGVNDKYYMNGVYWSEDAYKEYVAEYLGYWMLTDANKADDRFGPNNGIFYVKEPDTSSYRIAKGDDFNFAPAHIPGGDGYVYIMPKEEITLYTNNGLEISTDLYLELLNAHPEFFAGHFNEGRMYYPIAIRHNTNSGSNTSISTGDYGVVRNHWYYFTVDNINCPGIPVDEPGEEIIPNPEPSYEGLGVNISILNWHQIDENVDVNDQIRP